MRTIVRCLLVAAALCFSLALFADNDHGRGSSHGGGVAVASGAQAPSPIAGRGGHSGQEIEGIVQSVDSSGGTLTVADERLGTVTVETNESTLIRFGGMVLTMSDLATGMRVHVKASPNVDGTYLATEIIVQDNGSDGETEVSGTIASIDSTTSSFTVQEADGTIVTVATDSSTIFRIGHVAGTFANLAVGDVVEVSGLAQADGSILARRVMAQPPETEEVEIRGTVASIDASTSIFVVTTSTGDVTVATDASTRWHGHHIGGLADLLVGDHVEVEGTMQTDGTVLARAVAVGD
jgi:Domain of unknown function (DUF5666)